MQVDLRVNTRVFVAAFVRGAVVLCDGAAPCTAGYFALDCTSLRATHHAATLLLMPPLLSPSFRPACAVLAGRCTPAFHRWCDDAWDDVRGCGKCARVAVRRGCSAPAERRLWLASLWCVVCVCVCVCVCVRVGCVRSVQECAM